jgi:hypothetical protein
MSRAEALAGRFERLNQDVISTVERCSEQHWRQPSGAEAWSVAVTAHHIAGSYSPIARLLRRVALGREVPVLTRAQIDQGNAESAAQFANCSQAETLDLLRTAGAEAAGIIRALSDEQLDRAAWVNHLGATLSAEQLAEQVLIGHTEEHLASIRSTGAGRPTAEPEAS